MWVAQKPIQKAKLLIHVVQAVLTFVTGCLSLALLTEKGGHDSRVTWYFVLCFLTIPALLYQSLVPCWTKAWRFSNSYAHLGVDTLFSILWISAFGATASWTGDGIEKGADQLKSESKSCSAFAFGSASKCKTAKATTGFGVIICVLFLAAACISGLSIYRPSGPDATSNETEYNRTRSSSPGAKDEWSTNIEEFDNYSSYGHEGQDGSQQARSDSITSTDTQEGRHPGKKLSYASHKSIHIPYEQDLTPSAMSPGARDTRYMSLSQPSYNFSKE